MCSKYKHNIAIFFVMAILVMLADGTLHALIHASMHHTHELHAHHNCSHGSEAESEELWIASSQKGPVIFDDSHTESCMRCAEYLAQEHSQLASFQHKVATIHFQSQVANYLAVVTSSRVEHSSLRGPPEA